MTNPRLIGFSDSLRLALEAVVTTFQPNLFFSIGGTIALVSHNTTPEQLYALGDPSLRPLLLLSLFSEEALERTMGQNAIALEALVAQPQIMLWQLPCLKEELLLNLAAANAKTIGEENADALWAEFKGVCFGREARYILHDLQNVREPEELKFATLQERAHAIGVEAATPEELREKLQGYRYVPAIPIVGHTLDIAVDVEGTLVNGGVLNPHVVEFLRAQEAAGQRVIVWTGGDPEAAQRELARLGVSSVRVHAKDRYRGSTVRLAVDDQPEKLATDYGIHAVSVKRPHEI